LINRKQNFGQNGRRFCFSSGIQKNIFVFLRLQIAFGAFKEYILCVKSMLANPDELVVRAATIIKSKYKYQLI
jgi:hypothetical protein